MAFSMMESLSQLVTSSGVSQVSSYLGESDQTVKKGFSAAIPAVLGSVANRADDPSFMGQVYGLATDPDNDPGILGKLGSFFPSGAGVAAGGLGNRFTSLLFGGQRGAVENTLASYSGLKPSSAASLIGMVAPMVLAFLGKTARQTGGGAAGLAGILMDQKSSILGAIPGGFARMLPGFGESARDTARTLERGEEIHRAERAYGEARAYGEEPSYRTGSSRQDKAQRASESYRSRYPHAQGATGWMSKPWKWVIPGVLVLAGLWAISSLFRGREQMARAPATEVNLPYAETGVESRLIDDIRTGETGIWHNLERVTFRDGSPNLTPQSREELANVAAILQAHPNTEIALGGYSDGRDPGANRDLAQARAEQVKRQLIDLGAPPRQIRVEAFSGSPTGAGGVTQVGRGMEQGVAVRVVER